MKKLLIIILLLFSFNAFGQVYFSNTRQTAAELRANDFFARVTALGKTLTYAQRIYYINIFDALITEGTLGTTRAGDSLVFLYVFPLAIAGDSSVAKLNILDTSYTLTTAGTVYWTDSGYVSNGTTGYLKTGFIPTADSSIFRLNSAIIGVYSKTDADGNYVDMGMLQASPLNSCLVFSRGSNTFTSRLNNLNAVSVTSSNNSSLGMFCTLRRSSAGLSQVVNDNIGGVSECASSAMPNIEMYIGAYNYSLKGISPRLYPYAFAGSGLSDNKIKNLFNTLNNTLTIFNYNVVESGDTSYMIRTVKQDGSGDFWTIQGAIDSTLVSKTNPRYILIYPGTYNEVSIDTKSYCHLIGTDKETCIIAGYHAAETDTVILFGESTIEWAGDECNIENLTITIQNGRYCIHADEECTGARTIYNCILEHKGNTEADTYHGHITGSIHAFGHGFHNSDTVIMRKVTASAVGRAFFSHTGTLGNTAGYFLVDSCEFTSTTDTVSGFIGYYVSNGDVYDIRETTFNEYFWIINDVSILGFLLLTNVVYDSYYCKTGTCF